jgi:hypothetical protein
LDLLGFIRPNRAFSKAYERKNKKIRLASQVVCKTSQMRSTSHFSSQALEAARPDPLAVSGRSRSPVDRFGENSNCFFFSQSESRMVGFSGFASRTSANPRGSVSAHLPPHAKLAHLAAVVILQIDS